MTRIGLVLLASLFLVYAPTARGDLASGLTAYYPFDSDASDLSGNANHGTPFGSPIYVPGLVAGAISLDGFDDVVVLPASLLHADFSVSFQVRTSASAPFGSFWYEGLGIVDGEVCGSPPGGDVGIALIDGGRVIIHSIKSSTLVNDGAFHAVTVTRVGAATEIYIDGFLEASGPFPTALPLTGMPWVGVGNNPCDSGFDRGWFPGEIDELRFHDRALTVPEIRTLAGVVPPPVPALSPGATSALALLVVAAGTFALRHHRPREREGSAAGGVARRAHP